MFYPRDKKMPVMQIPEVCLPNGFKEKPKMFENVLFVGKLLEWTNPARALGIFWYLRNLITFSTFRLQVL